MTEQSSDSVPIPNRQKFAHVGAALYRSKLKNEWCGMYPVKGAKNDQYSFYCIPCLKNDHQGITDVKNHCSTATRKGYEKQATSQPSVSPSFKSQDPKDSVTRAEVIMNIFFGSA